LQVDFLGRDRLSEILCDWRCSAILNLLKTKSCVYNSEWIASRLNLSVNDTEKCLSQLQGYGLIEKSGIPNMASAKLSFLEVIDYDEMITDDTHIQKMKIAAQKLTARNKGDCYFSTFDIAVEIDDIEKIKKIYKKFRQQIIEMRPKDPKHVYSLNFQLFPLTEK